MGATGRPDPGEHIPYFEQYIRLAPDGDIVEYLELQTSEMITCLAGLSKADASWRPAPGEWCASEIVGHLIDTERVLSYRALRLARDDDTLPVGVEFDDYVVAGRFAERELASLTAEFAATRVATVAFLQGLDERAWSHRAPGEWSFRSVRAAAYILAGHVNWHLNDIQRIPRSAPVAG